VRKAYICPKCNKIMHKSVGNWDIWFCISCKYQYDTYNTDNDKVPQIVEVEKIKYYNAWNECEYEQEYPRIS